MCPSMCLQCTTTWMAPYINSSVHRALNEYVRRSGNYRHEGTAQLFVAYGRRVKGKPISNRRLSNWLVECIKFAYEKHDLPVPDGVKDNQTCKMAVT